MRALRQPAELRRFLEEKLRVPPDLETLTPSVARVFKRKVEFLFFFGSDSYLSCQLQNT